MERRIVVFAGNGCSKEKENYYFSLAYETGKLLALSGFITVTGGGPGLMDKVCQGAFENRGKTIGVCLKIYGRKQSKFLWKKYRFSSLYFRQKKLISLGEGFLALPGGIGTLYEISAVLALKRKGEIPFSYPLILIDFSYFHALKLFFEKMQKEEFISPDFFSLFKIVQTPKEAIEILKKNYYEIQSSSR